MRLKQFKLAGFKSFADPTAFEVPSQLVGVVGPNGCGKSNIMDAVRWVLGESRAAELRGESMQDVIFSGSSERKPASRASVELVFDNTLGRIGGSWGSFAELSVKRILTRDGQSSYHINNQQVRRKDVHDIFLGTGLGPRAYAIIGQGMISRIIEARPEDLRIFLEEAAGISRYKERRRETANRLADTRENLVRVEDILRELQSQIERLEHQAELARQYRSLEADREQRQRMLWIVRRDEALAQQQRIAAQRAEAATQLEARVAEQRALEARLEALRAAHYTAGDEVHAAQGRFYDANAEAARLEAEIRFVMESRGQLGERLAALEAQLTQAGGDEAQARAEAVQAQRALQQAEQQAEVHEARLAGLGERLPELEAALRRCRADVDEARAGVSELRQAIERSAVHRRAAEQAIEVATRRRERLLGEGDALQAPGAAEIEGVRLALVTAEAQEQQARERLADVDAAWRSADAARAPAQQALRDADARLARIEARLTALRQLQERAQSRTRIGPWLERHGLDGLERLWKRLRIEEGWETAVESLLRERVEALEIGQLDHLSGLLADAPPAKVSFHTPQALADAPAPVPGLRPLLALVRVDDAGLHSVLAEWLHGCHAAADLGQALAQRQSLPPGGRLVTPQGHVVGRLSLQFHAPDSEQEGVLARQHELEQLAREQRAQQIISDDSRAAATRAEALTAERLEVLSEARQAHEDATRQLSARRMDAQRAEQQLERASHARERIATELADADEAIESARFTVEEESAAFDRHDAQLAERQQRVEDLLLALEQAEQVLNQHREALRQAEREAQACAFSIREIRGRHERLEAQAAQARQRAEQAQTERAQVEARLGTLSDDAARAALDEALDRRHQEEAALSAARQRLEGLTHDLRALDEQRLLVERDQAPLRERVTALQLEEQAARLSAEQFAQQLAEAQVDEQAVRAAFADTPRAPWLQGEITRLGNAIAALGAVNLAALDELSAASERKGFLDAQSADLNQAIATLEDAIRRIDRETRALLQQTYDTVNQAFGRLFPELFGGGEARLILTGDEILDAGVQVMAQPPGKRNTSIHLLSGGEKALTAIALVFAMFQLNPAPFCLLDEVDAPLDDANTERYADMVRRMSDQTQFVFITHNKIAMEMAEQLVGVTMQERGVSRIVAVDLEAASRMAEAA